MNLGNKQFSRKQLVLGVASALALSLSTASFAEGTATGLEIINLEIKAQSARDSLLELSRKSGTQIILENNAAENITLISISGSYTLGDALETILNGSGLAYEFVSDDSVIVREVDNNEGESGQSEDSASDRDDIDEEVVVTGSRLITDPGKLTRQMTIFDRAEIERSGATRLDEFLRRLPQNVNAPNNLGSGFHTDSRAPVDFGLGANVFAGSSVNLRGIGSQYTLILIDGRRPPSGGQYGAITDISNIAIERVERIEVLFDGAAAIYGADAVGGVVNIITNREYEGTDVSLTYGDTTKGGGQRVNFNVGRTFNWGSGSLTATIGGQTQEQIDGSSRNIQLAEAESFLLPPSLPGNIAGHAGTRGGIPIRRPLFFVKDVDGNGDTLNESLNERLSGGVEIRAERRRFIGYENGVPQFETVETTTFVNRQNPQLGFGLTALDPLPTDPTLDGYRAVTFAQLPEFDGSDVDLYDINDSDELGADQYIPFLGLSLSPEDETYSAGLALDQEITEDLKLGLSLNYSKTEKISNTSGNSSDFSVSASSPANPFGQALRYAFTNAFPQEFQLVDQSSVSLSGDLQWSMNESWTSTLGFSLGKSKNASETVNQLRQRASFAPSPEDIVPNLQDLLNGRSSWRNFQTGESGTIELNTSFLDPNLGYGSPEALAAALAEPDLLTINDATNREIDFSLQGSLFETSAGSAITDFRLSHRRKNNKLFNSNGFYANDGLLDGSGLQALLSDYDVETALTTNAVAAEIAIPVLSSDMDIPFMQGLLFNAGARYEDYSTVEDKGFNWQLGMNWTVNDWMVVRLNRTHNKVVPEAAKSALPLTLRRYSAIEVWDDTTDFSTRRFVDNGLWVIGGGTADLKSERNNGTALGFIFTPTFAEGLSIQVNLTESETIDLVRSSLLGDPNSPSFRWRADTISPQSIALNPVLNVGDPDNNPEHRLNYTDFLGNEFDLAPGDLILDNRATNTGSLYNRGADLEVRYQTSNDWGDWYFTWRHQYLDVNEVVKSSICGDDNALCQISGRFSGRPVDTVGTVDRFHTEQFALPEHSGSLDLSWGYKGLGISLFHRYEKETTVVQLPDYDFSDDFSQSFINIAAETTRPAKSIDMTATYDFSQGDDVPDWLDGVRLSLSVSDLWRKDREVNVRYIQQEFEPEASRPQVNRSSLNQRGRAFTLRVSGAF